VQTNDYILAAKVLILVTLDSQFLLKYYFKEDIIHL